jgi:hypothetical protein
MPVALDSLPGDETFTDGCSVVGGCPGATVRVGVVLPPVRFSSPTQRISLRSRDRAGE